MLPADLGATRFDGKYHFIDPLDFRHPMLSIWRGNPKTGLTTVPISKTIQLEVPEGSEANIVAALDTGDPLIVEESIGRGRSILVATDGSTTSTVDADSRRPWSLLASWLNSQPFFESLWKAAVGGRIDERNVLVGEPLGARVEASAGDGRIYVVTPTGPVEMGLTADGAWTFSETESSGFYGVRVGSDTADLQQFAVNVEPRESDLDTITPDELPSGFTLRGDWQSEDAATLPVAAAPPLALHQLFLYAVLGLLFSETLLAWWIGHRSA